jgi:hypothetical protein
MLWHKPGGSWLWLLEPGGAGCTRLITRLRSRYAWARPTIVTGLILMEIGDPFMMRKCLLGIKQRGRTVRGRTAIATGQYGPPRRCSTVLMSGHPCSTCLPLSR